MTLVPITDISKHQRNVDFDVMASRGVVGVIIRLGNGKALDPMAATYVRGARAAGLVVGGYWFCNPKAEHSGTTQMARFAYRAGELDCLDIPPMMDVESFTDEYPNPGTAGITGWPLQTWLEDGADRLQDELGYAPIVYSNAAYFNSQHMVAASLARCSLIVARYPWYYPGAPAPPVDATRWEDWLFAGTPKRPQVPPGWEGWSGWQFAAGYNRAGATYGASSTDLDLNLIKPDAWARWLNKTGTTPPPPPQVEVVSPPDIPVLVRPPQPAVTPVVLDPIAYDPVEDTMPGNAPLIKMDKRYNEAFLVGAGTPVWLTGEDIEALKADGVPVADSGEHPSFEIVARRAGCDTLTARASR